MYLLEKSVELRDSLLAIFISLDWVVWSSDLVGQILCTGLPKKKKITEDLIKKKKKLWPMLKKKIVPGGTFPDPPLDIKWKTPYSIHICIK